MNTPMKWTAALLVAVFIIGTGMKSVPDKQKRDVSNFSEIGFAIPGTLYYTQGSSYSVVIEASADDLEEIITKIEGNSLIIKKRKDCKKLGDVKVYVESPKIEEFSIAGSGKLIAEKTIKSDDLEVELAGSGDVILTDVQVSDLEIELAGSGDVKVKGKCKNELEIEIAGSGDVDALDLIANKVSVEIAGSGSVLVHAEDRLDTSIAGSGKVRYKGNPLVDAESVGSGSTRAYN